MWNWLPNKDFGTVDVDVKVKVKCKRKLSFKLKLAISRYKVWLTNY